jgi:hypothetical protein
VLLAKLILLQNLKFSYLFLIIYIYFWVYFYFGGEGNKNRVGKNTPVVYYKKKGNMIQNIKQKVKIQNYKKRKEKGIQKTPNRPISVCVDCRQRKLREVALVFVDCGPTYKKTFHVSRMSTRHKGHVPPLIRAAHCVHVHMSWKSTAKGIEEIGSERAREEKGEEA